MHPDVELTCYVNCGEVIYLYKKEKGGIVFYTSYLTRVKGFKVTKFDSPIQFGVC